MELPDFLVIPGMLYKDREIKSMDRDIYGVVYWFNRMKNQKCTASNKLIADLLHTTPQTVANSLCRLAKRKYVTVILDEKNHRLEIIPNISYTPSSVGEPPSSTDDTPHNSQINTPYSVDEQNKTNEKEKKNKTTPIGVEEKSLKVYGNIDINEILDKIKSYYPNMTNIQRNRYAAMRMLKKIPKQRILLAIKFAYDTREEEFSPVITNIIDLEKKWDKLETFARRITKERRGLNDKKRGIDARGI